MAISLTLGFLGGTGPQGGGLAVRYARAGYRCLIGSRSADRARSVADELSGAHDVALAGADNAGVAAAADVTFVTVPYDGLHGTLEPLAGPLAGKLVVSCVNATTFDKQGPYWQQPPTGSSAQECQALLPGSQIASAFHTLSAKKLLAVDAPLEGTVPVCADDEDARERVVALVDELKDLRGIEAGALRLSFALEAMTALLIAANKRYKRSMGLGLVNLPPRA